MHRHFSKWRAISCSWIGRINIVKMTILPNAIYIFMQSISNYQWHFFHRNSTYNFTICMETQKTLHSQSNLEKEEWSWKNQISWLQTILQSYIHQDSMYWHRNRNIDQWNKIENPKMNSHTFEPFICDRRQNIQWRKDNLFSKYCRESWSGMCKRIKLQYILTPYTHTPKKKIS